MELVYTFKGLPKKNAVQKIYVDDTYIYAMQCYHRTTSIINRCTRDDEHKIAEYKDHMIINNAGHSQVLEKFTYQHHTCFLTAVTPYTGKSMCAWSIALARFQYKKFTTIDANELVKITFTGSERIEAALSSTNKYLVVISQYNFNSKHVVALYDFSKVNTVLDAGKSVGNDSIDAYKLQEKTYVGYTWLNKLKYCSNQGIDLGNDRTLYVTHGMVGGKYPPVITKMKLDGTILSSKVLPKHWSVAAECESPCLRGRYVYIAVCDKSKEDYNKIYKILKTEI